MMLEDTNRLFDYAVERAEGFTYADVVRDLEWERTHFYDVVRQMRRVLGMDELNLICDPQGQREAWRYRLVGNYDDARGWVANRVGDMESRMDTMLGVARACVNNSDGRTLEGRKARRITKSIEHLLYELGEIEHDFAEVQT